MKRIAWINSASGVSGDMILAALINAGADLEFINNSLKSLGLGISVTTEDKFVNGIKAAHITINTCRDDDRPRNLDEIMTIIKSSSLDEVIKNRAIGIFGNLFKVESEIHGIPIAEVRLHELGSNDSIADIIGAVTGLYSLEVETLYSSPVALGFGQIDSVHGTLPNPSPATVKLLENCPVLIKQINRELTTPTGAAIVSSLAQFSDFVNMNITAHGFGAGSQDIDRHFNAVELILGTINQDHALEQIGRIQSVIDDETPEIMAHLLQKCLDKGAFDAYLTPVVMKNSRSGWLFTCLFRVTELQTFKDLIFSETGTLGARISVENRVALPREVVEIDIEGEKIRVKRGPYNLKAEMRDLIDASERLNIPIKKLKSIAESKAAKLIT
jgi:uncharacterized protein (TIGR00299 family) protein